MPIKIAAAAALVAVLWTLFRFAMALRWSKIEREASRRAEERSGRRVVAELPSDGEVVLLLEDDDALRWGAASVAKRDVVGARLLLNGGVLAECARAAVQLPSPTLPEEFDGRERWEVSLYLVGGERASIPCGSLREGVSREIARRAFEAVRSSVDECARAPR